MKKSFFVLLLSVYLLGCAGEDEVIKVPEYTGPLMEVDKVETLYSDSAVRRVKLTADKQIELQNGDRDFPKGVFVEFFNESGIKTSTLKADMAHFTKATNQYRVRGNVIVQSMEQHKTLKTEELTWDPLTKKIVTDKFVTIETNNNILTGQGLTANQDFTYYRIEKPTGSFVVDK